MERDLRFMLAVMNRGTLAGDGRGRVLLERNPFKGYKVPKEKNPLRYLARNWGRRAEKRARLERKRGRGWHSLRRKVASDLKQVPLKTLQELGGWKTHETILMCYMCYQHDEGEMREALENRRTRT